MASIGRNWQFLARACHCGKIRLDLAKFPDGRKNAENMQKWLYWPIRGNTWRRFWSKGSEDDLFLVTFPTFLSLAAPYGSSGEKSYGVPNICTRGAEGARKFWSPKSTEKNLHGISA